MLVQEKTAYLKLIKNITPTRLITISFLVLIFIGGILLALPAASKAEPIPLINSFFVATSATCVTGLTMYDTFQTFTVFGQAVILLLIQLGGLGLATFATAFTLLFRKKLGFRNLLILSESAGSDHLNLMSLLKMIISMTVLTELTGALLLMIRFVPMCGRQGIWTSVFLSVSAYCNAGFDILGFVPGNSGVSYFTEDPLVFLTLSALIFIGGLGFVVVQEIWAGKIKSRILGRKQTKLSFHSKICLVISSLLVIVGMLLFFIFEYGNTMKDMGFFEKILVSFFQSVNTRSAGFAPVELSQQNDITKIINIMLMIIGGSPGSTAGGIKITTFVVMLAAVISTFRNSDDAVFWGHRFNRKLVYKSFTIGVCTILLIITVSCLLLYLGNEGETIDIVYEVVSAFTTVGSMSLVTPKLNFIGKILLMITMFIGRVGLVTFGIAIAVKGDKKYEPILPEGRMLIG